jgi:hypothetical protein
MLMESNKWKWDDVPLVQQYWKFEWDRSINHYYYSLTLSVSVSVSVDMSSIL